MKYSSVFLLVLSCTLTAKSAHAEEGVWNEYTIRLEDLNPAKTPTFESYPARAIYKGKPALVNLNSHPNAPNMKTRLRAGAKEGPNFAGYLTVVTWGCGTDCTGMAFVDSRNGKVYFDENLGTLVTVNIQDDVPSESYLQFKKNSRLIVAVGCPNEDCKDQRGVNYYVWTGHGLKHQYRVPKPWYPE